MWFTYLFEFSVDCRQLISFTGNSICQGAKGSIYFLPLSRIHHAGFESYMSILASEQFQSIHFDCASLGGVVVVVASFFFLFLRCAGTCACATVVPRASGASLTRFWTT